MPTAGLLFRRGKARRYTRCQENKNCSSRIINRRWTTKQSREILKLQFRASTKGARRNDVRTFFRRGVFNWIRRGTKISRGELRRFSPTPPPPQRWILMEYCRIPRNILARSCFSFLFDEKFRSAARFKDFNFDDQANFERCKEKFLFARQLDWELYVKTRMKSMVRCLWRENVIKDKFPFSGIFN